MLNDLRFALRQLRKSPGFTVAAVLTLAIGIGANTAVFSLVHAILLRQLPFRHADQVVTLQNSDNLCSVGLCALEESKQPAADFHSQENSIHSFSAIAEYTRQSANFAGDGIPAQRLGVAMVTSRFLAVLGVKPVVGRGFRSDEDVPGKDSVVLISYRLWQNRFGGDTDVVGRSIVLNGHSFVVIGVLPRAMMFPQQSDVWAPTIFDSNLRMIDGGAFFTPVIARLRDGVTMRQAQAELNTLYAANVKQRGKGHKPVLVSVASELTQSIRPTLMMLSGAVLLVMLIACANVAGLMLARASDRRAELAVRAALGAGRRSLIRQQLVESVSIALCGGVCGIVCAKTLLHLLYATRPEALVGFGQPAMELPVLMYTLAMSVGTGLLFGIAPAWFAAKQYPGDVLKIGQWKTSHGSSRLQRALVCGEIALAVVLLSGAGLLLRTMQKISAIPLGFRTDHLLTFSVALHGAPYETGKHTTEAVHTFQSNVLDGLRDLPGVVRVAGVSDVPLNKGVEAILPVKSSSGAEVGALPRIATPEYFQAMSIPFLKGRDFAESDGPGKRQVVIVTRDLAAKLWPGRDPIGQRLDCPWGCGSGATVIGVVASQRNFGARSDPWPLYYRPYSQRDLPNMTFVLRTVKDPRSLIPAVRSLVAKIDPSQPVFHVDTMRELLQDKESLARMELLVLWAFGILAAGLAATGIYGTVSYGVARRTREIGLRMALGAERRDITRTVLVESAKITLIGSIMGLLGAFWMGRTLKATVFGISTHDPLALAGAVALFFAVSAIASIVPARRAALVEPIEALRNE